MKTAAFTRKLRADHPQTVVVYGTSLTAGGAWVRFMQQELEEQCPGDLTLINSGGPGEHSRWGLANLQEKVLDHEPDVVFLEFSINDSSARYDVTMEESRRNLETLITRIKAARPECEIILQVMNPTIPREKGHKSYRPQYAAYQQIYREVAAEQGLLLIDHVPAWQAVLVSGVDAFEKVVPDGVHPLPEGERAYTMPALRKALGLLPVDT